MPAPLAGLALAVAASLGILAAAPHVLPDPPEQPYRALHLAGDLARLDRTVTAPAGRPLSVDFVAVNAASRPVTYRVRARVQGERPWPTVRVRVPADGRASGTVAGPVPEDGCLHRLALRLVGPGGERLAPLTVWVRGAGGPCR